MNNSPARQHRANIRLQAGHTQSMVPTQRAFPTVPILHMIQPIIHSLFLDQRHLRTKYQFSIANVRAHEYMMSAQRSMISQACSYQDYAGGSRSAYQLVELSAQSSPQ